MRPMSLFSYAKPRALGEGAEAPEERHASRSPAAPISSVSSEGGLATPNALVDSTGIEGLRGWTREKGKGLRIGALTPLVRSRDDRRSCESSRR